MGTYYIFCLIVIYIISNQIYFWVDLRETGETLESVSSPRPVSLCTRFSAFSMISSFSFNCLSSKLVGMFLEIVPMFVAKDFVRRCFIAQICANSGAHAQFGAYFNLRNEAI